MSLRWRWSKAAVTAFVRGAIQAKVPGKRGWHIPSGLDAALLEELPQLAPAVLRFWLALLEQAGPRTLTFLVPSEDYTQENAGAIKFRLKVDTDFLVSLLKLPDELETAPPEQKPELLGPDGTPL